MEIDQSQIKAEHLWLKDGSGIGFVPRLNLYKPEFILSLTPSQARGTVWLFSQPKETHRYIISGDPTFGIPGWHPGLSTEEDLRTDNAACSVWDITFKDQYIEQVAEYAAPVTPDVFAWVLNGLGRLYAGNDPLKMAQLIIESFPGPGPAVEIDLLGKYQYFNYWTPKPVDGLQGLGSGLSWRADVQSNKVISLNARKVIQAKKARIRSPWLAEEMNDAELTRDGNKWNIEVPETGNLHDDRLKCAMIGWYLVYGKEIILDAPTQDKKETPVEKGPKRDWQSSDFSHERMQKDWNRRVWEIMHN